MKHLRKFNEELIPRFPVEKKGEVIVFVNRGLDITFSFVKTIAKKLGYEAIGEINNGFIIKTNPGDEKKAGSDFVDNYPEFFGGYEREDLKDTMIVSRLDNIIEDVESLRDSIGGLNKFGKSMLPKDWNNSIDEIIKGLEDIKHE